MAQINHELGIPVGNHFDGFYNAAGRGRKKFIAGALLVVMPPAGAAYLALTPSKRSRYNTAMGSASNPPSHLIKEYYNNTKRDFPINADMTADQLQSVIDRLNQEYGRWDSDRDKKAAEVANNTKRMDKGDNKRIIDQLAAVRSWMYAINEYRAEVVKAYDKAVAKEIAREEAEIKRQTQLEAGKAENFPKAKPPVVGGTSASLPPSLGGEIAQMIDGGSPNTVGTDTKKKNTNIILYGVGGLLFLGLGYYFITKK